METKAGLKSILVLSANPKGTTSLRLQEEEEMIKKRLRLAGYGKVPIQSHGAATPIDIQQALLDFRPQVVHFSGHGSAKEGLVFEDTVGQEKLVSTEALANLFKLFSDQVQCVVLNACYSVVQAEAIAEHIPVVVGMSRAIGDRAAIEFAIGFYTALGAGETFEFAYKLGCNTVQLGGIGEHLTPVLFSHDQKRVKSGWPIRHDAPSIYPIPPPERPEPLSERALDIALNASLSNWTAVESPLLEDPSKTRSELFREYHFKTFLGAIEFMHEVAPGCEIALHHPRWENIWRTVRVYLTTWDIGHRISDRDVQLAKYLDNAFEKFVKSKGNV
jgi:pterin-4a-carbinolamine dehydratase